MPWVVSQLCQKCKDTSCADVCPVSCFYDVKAPTKELPDQLYISPDECIDCGACEPECPWEAIYEDASVPEKLKSCIELNARSDKDRGLFKTAVHADKPTPTPEQVAANKRAHGITE